MAEFINDKLEALIDVDMKLRLNRDNLQLWCRDAQENEQTKQKSILEGRLKLILDFDTTINQVVDALCIPE